MPKPSPTTMRPPSAASGRMRQPQTWKWSGVSGGLWMGTTPWVVQLSPSSAESEKAPERERANTRSGLHAVTARAQTTSVRSPGTMRPSGRISTVSPPSRVRVAVPPVDQKAWSGSSGRSATSERMCVTPVLTRSQAASLAPSRQRPVLCEATHTG